MKLNIVRLRYSRRSLWWGTNSNVHKFAWVSTDKLGARCPGHKSYGVGNCGHLKTLIHTSCVSYINKDRCRFPKDQHLCNDKSYQEHSLEDWFSYTIFITNLRKIRFEHVYELSLTMACKTFLYSKILRYMFDILFSISWLAFSKTCAYKNRVMFINCLVMFVQYLLMYIQYIFRCLFFIVCCIFSIL